MIEIFDPGTLPGELFFAIVILTLAWAAGQFLHWAVQRQLDRADAHGTDATSVRFLGSLTRIIVYIVALIVYTQLVPPLQSLGSAWLASVGIVSVVIGLATQSTLSNLIAGIALILYRPIHLGDRIQVATPTGSEIGVVESIDLGYTTLRAADGRRVVLPNSLLAGQTHINFSRNTAHVLLEISVTLPKSDDIDTSRKIFLEAAEGVSKIAKVNGCFVTSVGSAGAVLMLSLMCLDPGDVASIRSEVLTRAKRRLDAGHISLA